MEESGRGRGDGHKDVVGESGAGHESDESGLGGREVSENWRGDGTGVDRRGSDNFIHVVEAYKPRKDQTLAYLADSTATFPKYAHVSRHVLVVWQG